MELLNNKPLLELLSPFADKTLSEGCIVITEGEELAGANEGGDYYEDIFLLGKLISEDIYNIYSYVRKNDVCDSWEDNEYNLNLSNFIIDNLEFNEDLPEVIKTIGHIGITTVLEYINDKSFGDLKENKCINIVGDNLCCYLSGIDIYIPNKELHLYTKQELITLYNLLKELGNLERVES